MIHGGELELGRHSASDEHLIGTFRGVMQVRTAMTDA